MELYIIIIAIILISIIFYYNKVVKLNNQVLETDSGIDVALSKRANLIPNLVETVKGYAKHESETLEKIVAIRNLPRQEALTDTNNKIDKILAIAESYPELKADQQFLNLQKNLTNTEEHLQAARRLYNSRVSEFNTTIQSFPGSLFANMLNYKSKEFFKTDDRSTPNVKDILQQWELLWYQTYTLIYTHWT